MAEKKATAANPPIKAPATGILLFINNYPRAVLFALLSIISFFVFKDFIFFKKIYLFRDIGSDSINMYIPWINCYADYLKTEGVPGWSFQQGMGQNIFPLWLGDFFSNILMFFKKENIPLALAYVEIAKIIISGMVFYLFLKELKVSSFVSIVFGLLYAFSGFMIMGGSWIIYSIEAMNIAVILYGFERWLNHRKYFWFVFGIMLMTFLQPSLLFPYTIFLACYISARYYESHGRLNKEFLGFAVKTVLFAAIGVALAGYQLLPDILQILESPRVSGASSYADKLKSQGMFAVADPALRFTTIFRTFGTDMIGNGNNFRGWYNYLEAPLFYCGILCLVAFPQFFVSLGKNQRRVYGLIAFLFFLPLIFPYFRHAFWAFSGDYFRTYSLVIVLWLLIFSARALSFMEEKNNVSRVTLGVTILFLLFLLYTPSGQFKQGVNETMRSIVTVLILLYGFYIFRESDAKHAGKLKVLLLSLCVLELIYMSWSTVNNRDVLRKNQLSDRIGYNDYTLDAVNFLKTIDKNFYRINKDYFSGLAMHGSINDAKAQGYYGTPSYHSFNQKNYIKFLAEFNIIDPREEFATRWAKGLGERPALFSLAAGKYWFSKRTDNSIAAMAYDSIGRFGDVKVYRNRYVAPMGITYSEICDSADMARMSPVQKDFTALRACRVDERDIADFSGFKKFNSADTNIALSFESLGNFISKLKQDSLTITQFSENHIQGNISVQDKKILFLSFPFDEGWKARVNGQETKLYRVQAGLTGLILQKGANAVELNFEPRLKKKGAMLSAVALLVLLGLMGVSVFQRRKNSASVVSE